LVLIGDLSEREQIQALQVAATQPFGQVRFEPSVSRSLIFRDAIDFGFDLAFRGVSVSVPTAGSLAGVRGISVDGVELPTTVTHRAIVTPEVAATEADSSSGITVLSALNPANGPTVTFDVETHYIPVNANRTSNSPWRRGVANNELKGLPVIRDFSLSPMRDLSTWNGQGEPPAGPAIDDPDLQQITVALNNPPGPMASPTTVEVIYPNAQSGGRVMLWLHRDKTEGITLAENVQPDGSVIYRGVLPNFLSNTFYVEGTRPSRQENDITIRIKWQCGSPGPGQPPPPPITAEQTLTVVPFIVNMDVTPGHNGTVTLMRDNEGHIIGLNSGIQFPVNGGPTYGDSPGAKLRATVQHNGLPVNDVTGPGFVQNVLGVDNFAPAVSLTNGLFYDDYLREGDYPILDYVEAEGAPPVPLYPSALDTSDPNGNQAGLLSADTPSMGKIPDFADVISGMDLTFRARLYTVWKFADETLYTLASVDWQVVFKASLVNGVLTPDPSSVVSAQPFVRTAEDPLAAIGPYYNQVFDFLAYG
jgi:hypothetical protein